MTKQEKIAQFKTLAENSTSIVFFGGAGVSTESGIPDFRSKDGLYHQQYDYPPEEILSHTFFVSHTKEFYRFYRDKLNSLNYQPNITHRKLAEWEQQGRLTAVVTQNIDGLHQKAGSRTVLELHGSVMRNYCRQCGRLYGPEAVFHSEEDIPHCECGGVIKPDVVLYEEALDNETVNRAINAIASADMLIVAGTSLTVYPASGLIRYFQGRHLVLINRDATPYDDRAGLVIHAGLGEVFSAL